MKKIAFILVLVVLCLALAHRVQASEEDYPKGVQVMEDEKLPYEFNTWLLKTVCVQGHTFLMSYVLGRQADAGVNAIEIQEEKDGRMVPMTCDPAKIKKRKKTEQPSSNPPGK